MMILPLVNQKDKYTKFNMSGYTGLANPASMMRCNASQLASQNENCEVCSNAAQNCMNDPYSSDCQKYIQKCKKSCHNKNISSMVEQNCSGI